MECRCRFFPSMNQSHNQNRNQTKHMVKMPKDSIYDNDHNIICFLLNFFILIHEIAKKKVQHSWDSVFRDKFCNFDLQIFIILLIYNLKSMKNADCCMRLVWHVMMTVWLPKTLHHQPIFFHQYMMLYNCNRGE